MVDFIEIHLRQKAGILIDAVLFIKEFGDFSLCLDGKQVARCVINSHLVEENLGTDHGKAQVPGPVRSVHPLPGVHIPLLGDDG